MPLPLLDTVVVMPVMVLGVVLGVPVVLDACVTSVSDTVRLPAVGVDAVLLKDAPLTIASACASLKAGAVASVTVTVKLPLPAGDSVTV